MSEYGVLFCFLDVHCYMTVSDSEPEDAGRLRRMLSKPCFIAYFTINGTIILRNEHYAVMKNKTATEAINPL